MPKLVKALGADDRYNLLLGIIGYLLRHESAQIDDLATHFKTTSEHIRSAISTIALSGFVEAGTHQVLPFNFDWEALEDDGTVTFIDDDIVTEGEAGLLVPADNPVALARACDTLVADAELRRRMGASARERYEQMFEHEVIVERTLEAFLGIITQPAAATAAT